MRKKICIALAIIWMGVIFYMSNQPASISSIHSGNTINIISKLPIIGNIMDYLTSINIGEFIVRKCAHMFSYCILAIFLFMSVYEDNIKKAIISTNEYHLPRAIFIARSFGIEAYGIASDMRQYDKMKKYKIRERVAQLKDFFLCLIKMQ